MKSLNKKNLKKINQIINHYHVYIFIHDKYKKDTDEANRAWASYNWCKAQVTAIDLYKDFGISLIAEDYIAEIDETYTRYKLEQATERWLNSQETKKSEAAA